MHKAREVKFRAWDIDHRNFVYFDLNNVDNNLFGRHGVVENTVLQPWQEYTGLKDKNGKEIYEGDIIKSQSFAHGRKEGFKYKTVAWRDGRQGVGFNVVKTNRTEVIGNIYENSNLLETKQER